MLSKHWTSLTKIWWNRILHQLLVCSLVILFLYVVFYSFIFLISILLLYFLHFVCLFFHWNWFRENSSNFSFFFLDNMGQGSVMGNSAYCVSLLMLLRHSYPFWSVVCMLYFFLWFIVLVSILFFNLFHFSLLFFHWNWFHENSGNFSIFFFNSVFWSFSGISCLSSLSHWIHLGDFSNWRLQGYSWRSLDFFFNCFFLCRNATFSC